jgi:hypothetical protein
VERFFLHGTDAGACAAAAFFCGSFFPCQILRPSDAHVRVWAFALFLQRQVVP